MSISVPQIAAQLDDVLTREPSALTVAICAATKQDWPESITQRGRKFSLKWCESMLAMREAMCDVEQTDTIGAGLVVLTPLRSHQIAEDIVARLARRRIVQPEGWATVRQLFCAKEIDARLSSFPWMPQVLTDATAQGPYMPVPNGFLDLETAWKEVLQRFLMLEVARPDAGSLLRWTMLPSVDASLSLLPSNAKSDAIHWLRESSGTAGSMVLACIQSGRIGDAFALGLVCGVLFAPAGEGEPALGNATIRLERYVNDTHVGLTDGRAWAAAARDLTRDGGVEIYRSTLERADVLLVELRVSEFAYLSDILPQGLEQRMRMFALALTQHTQAPTDITLNSVEEAANRVLSHELCASQPQRADRVEMARRIARWLLRPEKACSTVADFVSWQADEGAFVDWARFRLLGGDEQVAVSEAYKGVRSAVIARRNSLGRKFSVALQQWNLRPPSTDAHIVPLESVLEKIVAPLSVQHPVLLLVMDGLSTSIFRELFAKPERLGWSEMVLAATARPLAGVAVLPTVTEVSRASLLCGKLTTGAASVEKNGFSTHAALLTHSRANHPPKLFHKGDLSDATNLSAEVRDVISNKQQRVVGLVYNAVDDHLSGPDQLHQRWDLEDLRLLLPILQEARIAGRVVVITADHGHMLEDGTTQTPGGESDRWRVASATSTSDEIVLTGGRVRTSSGAESVTCLWSESVRYTGRKNGYHGGASLQEVTVPLSVFVPFGVSLADWQAASPAQPEWWDLPNLAASQTAVIQSAPAPRVQPSRPAPTPAQAALFDVPTEVISTDGMEQTQDWISLLLQSQIYLSQRSLAARVAPADEQMRKLLEALDERGGKLTRAALAQRLAVPEVRLNGMLSAVRRILNVDQATVLSVDESAGTVDLNRVLLLQQFRITINGGAR